MHQGGHGTRGDAPTEMHQGGHGTRGDGVPPGTRHPGGHGMRAEMQKREGVQKPMREGIGAQNFKSEACRDAAADDDALVFQCFSPFSSQNSLFPETLLSFPPSQ